MVLALAVDIGRLSEENARLFWTLRAALRYLGFRRDQRRLPFSKANPYRVFQHESG